MTLKTGWEPMPSEVWHEITEHLPKPWTAGQAAHDLRVYAAEVSLGRRRKMPGRPTLSSRWGWTDYKVKQALKDEASWGGFTSKSPADRQRTASAPPAFDAKEQVSTDAIASPSPADRQPIATRAELQTSNNKPQTETPCSPPAGDVAPVEKSGDNPKPSPTRSQKPKRKRTKYLTQEEILEVEVSAVLTALPGWSDAWTAYAEHRQELKAGRWETAVQVGRMLTELERENGKGNDVVEALHKSTASGYRGVFPKPYKPGTEPTAPQGSLPLTKRTTDPAEVWQAMLGAMARVGGRRLPTIADVPSLDEPTLGRALAVLGGPARWSSLCRTKADDLHFRVRPHFVRSWREVA